MDATKYANVVLIHRFGDLASAMGLKPCETFGAVKSLLAAVFLSMDGEQFAAASSEVIDDLVKVAELRS